LCFGKHLLKTINPFRGKVLTTNFEGDLSGIDDKSFIDLQVIDKAKLLSDYGIKNKLFGIVIKVD